MLAGIGPLGRLRTPLPVGKSYPGRTAGPTFELFYECDYLLPHRRAAWALLRERLQEAVHFCDRIRSDAAHLRTARRDSDGARSRGHWNRTRVKGRAMTPARTEAFSDGVFSIAATLLVLDLKVPTARGDLLSQLLRAWPSYASYVVSFMTIGIIWINHHVIFGQLRRIDRTLQVLNLALLLTVALTPFPTAILGAYLEA